MSDAFSVTAIPSAPQVATNAIKRSVQRTDQDAAVIANSQDVMSREAMEAMIDSRQQLIYTQAAAKVLSTDLMTQALIDTQA